MFDEVDVNALKKISVKATRGDKKPNQPPKTTTIILR
jgi:hypothetical protein